MLDVYFSIMADLEHIGVSSFNCAEINSLPSGTHAVFMAAMACEKVDLYGVSYTKDQARGSTGETLLRCVQGQGFGMLQ